VNTSIVTTMLRALLRWWWLIILAVSLGVGVGYLLRTEQADLYYAEATVLIGQDSDSAAPIGVDREVLDAYTVLITRNSLLQPVIDDLGLNISVGELLDYLSVTTNENASLVTIGIIDTDPERSAAIANRIVDELIRQTSDRATVLDLEFINSQIESIQKQITDLQSQYNTLAQQSETLTSAFDLNQNLEDRQEIEETIQELRTLLLSMLENAPRSEVQIFEQADPNYFPITANNARDMIFAGAAGGILAVLTIILFTFFDDRLQWEEGKQEDILGLKVLAPLGIIPRQKLPLYVETYPQSIEAEALRQLRAKIALAAGNMPRVLTVMSYDSGEGKTLTSSNIALENARSGLRTLAIDGDMRQGDIHEVFQLPNIYGLSDILQSNEPIADLLPKALLNSGYDKLTIMPSGRAAADPAALLGKPRFVDLIDMLANRYDAIVIDAAPTIAGPDAVFLSDASDGVIIVVNARRTRISSLRQSIEELQAGPNVKILGLVFNRVRLQVTSKYNNTYYRQTPTLTPEKLGTEMARPGGNGFFAARRHIITDRNGDRLFSVDACAARLGIKRRTVLSWIDSGYVQAERHYLRPWVRESSINAILEQRMTAAPPPEPAPAKVAPSTTTANGTGQHGPEQLREQREAILDFLNRPGRPDPEN
jgi:capsular exopolysaccharide synthesis family protein